LELAEDLEDLDLAGRHLEHSRQLDHAGKLSHNEQLERLAVESDLWSEGASLDPRVTKSGRGTVMRISTVASNFASLYRCPYLGGCRSLEYSMYPGQGLDPPY